MYLARINKELFFYLLLLTGFFFLLEVSFFIQCNKAYLNDFQYVTDHLPIPLTVLPGILFFIIAQLVVHLGYCLLAWVVALGLVSLTKQDTLAVGISVWLFGLFTMLLANQYFFPNSKFAELTAVIFANTKLTYMLLIGCSVICAILLFIATISIIPWLVRGTRTQILPTASFLLCLIFIANYFYQPISTSPQDASTAARPNIIVIGIDSLRPDFLSYNGGRAATPFLDNLLNRAVIFPQAVTSAARTFPSWVSLLTGEYPRQIGVRYDLADQEGINFSQSLPAILMRHGYSTIYATDETRFSNIDKNLGFQNIISPPMGLNDFLLGTFNDFPISNLLVNTKVGKWLFPYSYANRPGYITYNPDTFISLLKYEIPVIRHQPLFLAVHFCLPHTPYLWAGLSENNTDYLQRYVASLQRVDQQLNDFFKLLQENQLLQHALIVVMSDHGEALELSGDRITAKALYQGKHPIPNFYPPSLDNEAVNESAGHGTDVLGLPQYRSLLAFLSYGDHSWPRKKVNGTVSLQSIQPTVLNLIGIQSTASALSLANIITKQTVKVLPEHIFIESDLSPRAIRTVYPEIHEAMLEGIHLFSIHPSTTRLTFKKEMGFKIIRSKQYADIYGDWILALYPTDKNSRIAILVNLKTGEWTDDMHSPLAKQAPVFQMYEKMKYFYQDELSALTHNLM